MYEFEPYFSKPPVVPTDPAERRAWLRNRLDPRLSKIANLYRDKLIELYGEQQGRQIKYAEAFEVCEYGTPLADDDLSRLFPMIKS